jgi:oligopeptide/dipeptide ABC transporter ATP-binding protein
MVEHLLEVKELRTYFQAGGRTIPAVDGVSFNVNAGETLCIVGESGCGKSVTSLSVMKLVPTPPGRYVSGEILFCGQDLLKKTPREMVAIRGKNISMISQEPMTALNPVHTIGAQISEALSIHEGYGKKEAWQKAVEMLAVVGVPDPLRCAKSFPHQFSGGMRQRAMIAMAFCCNPKLLIADEPTTALDVTIQAQILELISQFQREHRMTVMLITHDLGVVAEIAQRVLVMYAGKIVEEASCKELFAQPLHPYTKGLLRCIPRVDKRREVLSVIEGQVPNPANLPSGCSFHPRCIECTDICRRKSPPITAIGERRVSCHKIANMSGVEEES